MTTSCDDAVDGLQIDTLSILTLLVICFISLAVGTTVVLEEMRQIYRSKKRAFLLGWASQFGFMPLMAFAFASCFDFDQLVAVGVVLVGMAPGGSTSNLFTLWARGNVALSVAMSAASTTCALFMLPLLYLLYVRVGLGLGDALDLPVVNIVTALLTIVVPVALGAYIRRANTTVKLRGVLLSKWVERGGTVIGAVFLVAAVVNGVRSNTALMDPTRYPSHWVVAALFQPIGCAFGFAVATLSRLERADVRAVSLECGVQNYALVLALVQLSFSGCEQEAVSEFVLVSSAWYVISSLWIVAALRWLHARRDPPAHARPSAAAGVRVAGSSELGEAGEERALPASKAVVAEA